MDREGVILKKCDTQFHRPGTNRGCREGTCGHTCEKPDRCTHAWTLRYFANGKQRERSFRDQIDGQGRVQRGSGKRLAADFQLKLTHDKRAEGKTFIDHSVTGKERFSDAVDSFVRRLTGTPSTRKNYNSVGNAWVKPAFEGRSIAQMATDREGVADLLNIKMKHLSQTRREHARWLIIGTLTECVISGKIPRHNLLGIDLASPEIAPERTDFVFPAYEQVKQVAGSVGIAVWLMRGSGLRIGEALGVHREDFVTSARLELSRQAAQDGRTAVPWLKHRKPGETRSAVVPPWLWEKVRDCSDGPLCPGVKTPYMSYQAAWYRFSTAAAAAGIPKGFTPHSLRHAFATELLGNGIPITDVARWLGHRSINVTYRIYSHFLPDADQSAIAALEAAYEKWTLAA